MKELAKFYVWWSHIQEDPGMNHSWPRTSSTSKPILQIEPYSAHQKYAMASKNQSSGGKSCEDIQRENGCFQTHYSQPQHQTANVPFITQKHTALPSASRTYAGTPQSNVSLDLQKPDVRAKMDATNFKQQRQHNRVVCCVRHRLDTERHWCRLLRRKSFTTKRTILVRGHCQRKAC
jgi:hypothetical protein